MAVSIGRQLPDARLVHLVEHFPSAKGAVRLDMEFTDSVLPTDAALHRFKRLQTIVMHANYLQETSSFWDDLFASKAFRRVPNIINFDYMCIYQVEVDDGALLDFITDFSLMPADKARVVSLGRFSYSFHDALKRRFDESKYSWQYGLRKLAVLVWPTRAMTDSVFRCQSWPGICADWNLG